MSYLLWFIDMPLMPSDSEPKIAMYCWYLLPGTSWMMLVIYRECWVPLGTDAWVLLTIN